MDGGGIEMSLSTHVLETSQGRPGVGVEVMLEAWLGEIWVEVGRSATDANGRCRDLLAEGAELRSGRYRLRFETGDFYARRGERCLYPFVEVVFEVMDERHYHVPLLLTANGYTTYRGS